MIKINNCRHCNHEAVEHGIFRGSDINKTHSCNRYDCRCSQYVN